MGTVVEAELRLKGSDRTAAAFAGVIKHAEELQSKLRGVNFKAGNVGLAEQGAEIRKNTALLRAERMAAQEINRTFRAGNEALAARVGLFGRLKQHAQGMAQMSGMGWMMGGLASGRLAHKVAGDTAEFAHQRALLAATSGMKPNEVSRAVDQAISLRVPMMSASDNLKAIGELRMVFGSTEHAIENLASVQRAAAMMKAVNPHMNGEEESYNLARALELKGVSNDPAHFTKLSNMMVQAVNASRGKITGSEFFEFTKYARGGAARLSDDFYTRVAPTLIQELGGHSAGMALSSFRQTLVGGKMTNKSAEEWVKLGLIDPAAVIHTKTGSVKGIRPGGLVDSGLASENPYEWIQKHLKPALDKAGIVDKNKIAEEMAHLFSNRFSEQMASILLTQSQRIEKDRALIGEAPGSEALEKLRGQDPTAAALDLSAAINSLLSAFGNPLASAATATMNKLADGARFLASSYHALDKAHPWAAKGASVAGAAGLGYVGLKGMQATFGLLTGSTALKGSALALSESAAALNGAAARLGLAAGGPVSKIPLAAGGSRFGGAVAAAAGVAPIAIAAGGLIAGGVMLHDNATQFAGLPLNDRTKHWRGGKSIQQVQRESFNRDRARLGIPLIDDHEHVTPEAMRPLRVEDVRGRVGGGYIEGSAEIHTKVDVSPSPDFITRIETMISNAIHGISVNGTSPTGSSGSTGGSMPEAAPSGP
ncbi:MAG: hypothetical protein GC182_08530 [Rhodopseudomonas sp.]|nr:hypothetical protein [Rhodopseudomonas sp.]